MKFDYFWKFLLLILTIAFVLVKKIKGYLRLSLAMFYNRQKRARLFKSLIISEEQVLQRIQKLPKLPSEVVICLGSGQKFTKLGTGKIKEIVNLTQKLEIRKCKLFINDSSQLSKIQDLQQDSIEFVSFKSFYSQFIQAVNTSTYNRRPNNCSLILVFNSIPCTSGLPFTDLKGGEIMINGDLDSFSMIDYEECFKRFAGIEQRLGR